MKMKKRIDGQWRYWYLERDRSLEAGDLDSLLGVFALFFFFLFFFLSYSLSLSLSLDSDKRQAF
jgi:hypothetical protein